MNVENETMMAKAEALFTNKGIDFKLPVDAIDHELYDGLLSAMLEYIGKYTDKPVEYIGDWEITIRAKDVQFNTKGLNDA